MSGMIRLAPHVASDPAGPRAPGASGPDPRPDFAEPDPAAQPAPPQAIAPDPYADDPGPPPTACMAAFGQRPPPQRPRVDGWTPERQRAFLELLADSGSVTTAALRVGMSRESAYRLRRRRDSAAFADAWDAAIAAATRRLTDSCFERAIDGVAVPIMFRGEKIGTRYVHSDALAMFLLRHHDPVRYGNLSGARSFDAAAHDAKAGLLRRLPLLLNRLLRRGRWVDVRTSHGL